MPDRRMRKPRSRIPEVLDGSSGHLSDSKKANTTWQKAMEDFLLWKKAHGVSEATLKGYNNHIKHFYKKNPLSWGKEEETKQGVLEHLSANIKPATYNLRLIYLRAFYDWCIGEGFMYINPLDGYKKRKAPPRIVEIPLETLQHLLKLPNQQTYAGLRDYSLIMFTLDTGTRPSEAFQLTVEDFDINNSSVTVPESVAKTRQSRTLPLLPSTMNTIKKLIRVRPDDWGEDLPVFSTTDGENITRKIWSKRMNEYSKELNFKIRPYDLRHAFAIMYLRNGGNAFSLQKLMGHENMDMTKRYLNITGQDLREAHEQASPINKLIPKKNTRIRKLK